jgi:hypothetical protein
MPLSNAEKQRKWREAHVGTDKARVQLILDVPVAKRLKQLARQRKLSLAALVEALISPRAPQRAPRRPA